MNQRFATAILLFALPSRASGQGNGTATEICLAPTSVTASVGAAAALSDAVKESLTGFLSGPSMSVSPLSARLDAQVMEEAKLAGCQYVLFTEVKQQRKQGGSLLGQVAAGAFQQGAWQAAGATGSGVGRGAANTAAGAASATASQLATSTRAKDELSLNYRLETGEGKVLVKKSAKRKASSDGEDLLSPVAKEAAESVASAIPPARP